MNTSTPISPLARTVLTRIQSMPAAGAAWRRRLVVVALVVGATSAVVWGAMRGRVESKTAPATAVQQVRPAIPLTPARRIHTPQRATPTATDASALLPSIHR